MHALLTGMQRHLKEMPGDTLGGATFSKVPAHYPDPGNPGHYMNVFKTPTTLNDGQQQPVDNFAPRANLKFIFFKDGAISSCAS